MTLPLKKPSKQYERAMFKVVFDTVIFVRSLINPHGKWGKLVFNNYQLYQLYVSEPILIEILEVLKRPELTVKFKTLQTLDFPQIITILGQASCVELKKISPVCRDPKDDKFLATAVSAKADYLVSEDKDLLDFKEYRGIKIVKTEYFLNVLK